MNDEEIRQLIEMLPFIQGSFEWMLKTIVHKARETNGDNYSDELKVCITVGEFLEKIKGK